MQERVSTGVAGLDEILCGGLVPERTYLLSGPPGGGKTTLGWHFLCAAVREREPALFVTFGENERDLRANAQASGFRTDDVRFCDMSPSSDIFARIQSYDIFSAAEVELEPITRKLRETVEREAPVRIFIDSMTALRYLARDAGEFRRQTLSFLRFLQERGGTILLTAESSGEAPDDDLRYLCDGVIELAPHARTRTRTLRVLKFRGSDFRAGDHTLRLDARGASVFPRLVPEAFEETFEPGVLSWGVPELDAMSCGGIERGTVSILTGPSGIGKTTIGVQFMKEAAERGERSAIYSFDERVTTVLERCESVGIPARAMSERGTLSIVAIEALKFSADEFANLVRADVEGNDTRIVMIDSISGYRLSVSSDELNERLHALCRYLQNVGVTVLLVNETLSLIDSNITTVGISYLADNVFVMRYIERVEGGSAEIGRAIGVVKKRLSDFEKTLRPFTLTYRGIEIGQPLPHLGGLLGAPAATEPLVRT
ncbi:MAG: ATPase domain-containing protein [Vulcanimicrobiaceae bacterium]